ncbi:hypothetical protein QUB60_08745 [Microcoleus sp. A2-C5]
MNKKGDRLCYGRRKKEEGRRKREEGRGEREKLPNYQLSITSILFHQS